MFFCERFKQHHDQNEKGCRLSTGEIFVPQVFGINWALLTVRFW